MSSKLLNGCLFGTLLIAAMTPIAAADEPLPHDDRIVTGTLPNGVTWKFYRNDNPPGKMMLMMHVQSGSLNETDAQRGLAHFLEHMAFNGSEHFKPGELIPYFESIGMEFGADLNAFTSFDQTAYMLFTPDTTEHQIDQALLVLSDMAFRLLLLPKEIDDERGVILAEKRTGQSAGQRIRDEMWPKLFAGSRFAQRLPIGTDEVIRSAPYEEFSDYYRTWYRPENITVIAVGDAPLDEVKPLIARHFGDYRPETAARTPAKADFKAFQEARALLASDPEQTGCEVELIDIRAGRPNVSTAAAFRTRLVEQIGMWIMSRRFDELVNQRKVAFRDASTSIQDFFDEAVLVTASANGEPEDWEKMLEQVVVEVNRAVEHGFTQRELELARSEIRSRAQREVKTEPTRSSQAVLFQIMSDTNSDEPTLSAQQNLDLTERFLPEITVDEVTKAFVDAFSADTFAYVVTMPDKEGVTKPAEGDILAAARAARQRKTEAPAEESGAESLLAELPAPGQIAETTADADLDITSGWLTNGVRFHHRFMDYKKDTVLMTISLAGAGLRETADNKGISEVAALAFRQPATRRLSSTQVDDLLTGKNISVRGGAEPDSLVLRISGSPDDLETGLQLAYALLTEPQIEQSAFDNWRKATLQRLEMLQYMPEYQAMVTAMTTATGDDRRLQPLTVEDINKLSLSPAQAWLERHITTAPIEVAVVGEITLENLKPLLERYLGALDQRPRTDAEIERLREIRLTQGPWNREVQVPTITPRGTVVYAFVGPDARNVDAVRALNLAQETLSSRLIKRIREELALVYSIQAANRVVDAYNDWSTFLTMGPCEPGKADEVAAEIKSIFSDFAANGPTDEEVANAHKQVANNLDTDMKEPSYWLSVLSHLDQRRLSLDEQKHKIEAYQGISATQIRDAFAEFYRPDRIMQVIAVPATGEAATPAKPAEAGTR